MFAPSVLNCHLKSPVKVSKGPTGRHEIKKVACDS